MERLGAAGGATGRTLGLLWCDFVRVERAVTVAVQDTLESGGFETTGSPRRDVARKWFLLFVLPLLALLQISLVGQLVGTEIVFVAVVGFAVVTKKLPKPTREEKQFYFFVILWLIEAVITDVIRGTSSYDCMRGWSKIVFFALNFTAIRYLYRNDLRLITLFCVFFGAACALKVYLGLSDIKFNDGLFGSGWKFGYGGVFTYMMFLLGGALATDNSTRVAGRLLPFGAPFVSLLLNARNMFGTSALAALVGLLLAGRKRAVGRSTILVLCLGGVLGGIGLISVYQYAASNGILGEKAAIKYQSQNLQSLGVLGVIVGGRSEMLAAVPAIIESPIIGHGSYARDLNYVIMGLVNLQEEGANSRVGNINPDNDLIPTHSHLLGAWVESGILGAVFWVWVLWQALRGIYGTLRCPSPYIAVLMLILINILWNVLFSPFGLERRVDTAAYIYLAILAAGQPRALADKQTEAAGEEGHPADATV
jgi:hypothetical protein